MARRSRSHWARLSLFASVVVVVVVASTCFCATTAFTTRTPQQQQHRLTKGRTVARHNFRFSAPVLNRRDSPCSHTTTTTRTTKTAATSLQIAANPAAVAATTAAAPLASVAVLAFIVLIHELGHYSASKFFGVAVEEFSVGFGPKLLSFTLWQDEFNLRALPLGGYVRFPENYNTTLARELEEAEFEEADAFIQSKRDEMSFGARILNAVTLGALDDKLWSDEKKRRRAVLEELETNKSNIGSNNNKEDSWWSKFVSGNKKTKKKDIPKVPGEIEYYDDPKLLQNRPWFQRAIVLCGGVIFNLLLAFSIYFGQINFGSGLPVPVFDNGIVVTQTPAADAAARGILRQGDVIVAVDGRPLAVTGRVSDSQKAISEFIAQIRATPDGESLRLDVQHNNNNNQKSNQLEQVRVQPQRKGANEPQTIGVLLSPNYLKTDVLKTSNPVEAGRLALGYCTELTQETASGLFSFFAGFVAGGSNANAGAQVSGPIGLIKTGSDVVSTQDWSAVLLFAAAISINLGVINSIPLPALDGGQLVFVLAEAVTGRKVDQRFQEGITGVAVLFLLLLSAGTFVGDLSSILGTR